MQVASLYREYRWAYILLVTIVSVLAYYLILQNILYPILLAAALVPGIVYIAIVRSSDVGIKEPKGVIALYLIIGILMIFPAIYLENYGIALLQRYGFTAELTYNLSSILFWFLFAAIIVAPVEELLKWFGVIFGNLLHKEDDEVSDTIVYSVAVAGGFALYENYRYVFGSINSFSYADVLTLAIARSFTAIPLHLGVAMIMGYYLSGYLHYEQFGIPESQRKIWLLKALIYSVIIHGAYDIIVFLVFDAFTLQVSLAIIFVTVLNFVVWKHVTSHNLLNISDRIKKL